MKKTVGKFLFVVILGVLTLGLLCGCKDNIFLKKLELRRFGDMLVWDSIEKAESYEIYQNGTLLDSTINVYYRVPGNKEEQSYTVRAKKSDGKDISRMSNEVCVERNLFMKDEILKVDLTKRSGTIVVGSDIKFVEVTGKSSNTCFVIEYRTDDLRMFLNSAQIYAPSGESCIAYGQMPDNQKPQFTTCIEVKGECSLHAGSEDYVPPQPAAGSKQAGTPGITGSSGISLSKIAIYGKGNLSVYGGRGGQGGTGANSKGTSMQAAGASGGSGGTGINCTECYIAIAGEVSAQGGEGGKGGTYGSGNASLGGLLGATFVGPNNFYASDGARGSQVSGTFHVLSGVVNWD